MSDKCELGPEHHRWRLARLTALERAGWACVRCPAMPRLERPDPAAWRSPLGYAHAEAAFLAELAARGLEVHHDPPVGERGYRNGCAHHQSKLYVLCRAHHLLDHQAIRGDGQMEFLLAA